MSRPEHRIRWKRDCIVEILNQWCQDTGQCRSHEENRAVGQEEDATVRYHPGFPEATVVLGDESTYYDSTSGCMIYAANPDDFEIVRIY
jgi:hypothetical protein